MAACAAKAEIEHLTISVKNISKKAVRRKLFKQLVDLTAPIFEILKLIWDYKQDGNNGV